ncbi:ABC transporter permease [Streptomyces bambusae]|uniref:FtsX-like permease family protein n=1 Tax=Streptomyces bambusae TaxID=1550616 RepID=UPI001CFE9C70|nr:FtsX-like permease family protein [Streptomyces bambusae]MCB5165402.1 ABC transporter permease [Streptomyces bambusae]
MADRTPPPPGGTRRARTVAPWVRTRLVSAPGAALAFAVLVLVSAFLAAVLPRAVDAYETDGLRREIAGARPDTSALKLVSPQLRPDLPMSAREDGLRPAPLAQTYRAALAALPAPLRADPRQSAYGVRSRGALTAADSWLPRPNGVPPRFTFFAQSDLAAHSVVRSGRLPAGGATVTAGTRELEAAVTEETARALRLKAGSVVRFGSVPDPLMTVRITGVVRPQQPARSYWSAEPLLRTPGLRVLPGSEPPALYWEGGLLIAPDAAPALLAGDLVAMPERYWHFAPDGGRLTGRDTDALLDRLASLEGGPELLRMRGLADDTAVVSTGLEEVLADHVALRTAIGRLVGVAVFGIAAVAAVVLAMAGGLALTRRNAELALLRSRGGSLAGIAGRLLGETAVVALPAAGLGLLAAVLLVPGARLLPAVLGAAAVAVLACAVLPLRAAVRHRRPQPRGGREDLVRARPGRRRLVAELTVLVLAAGSVAALRRRGADGGDLLVTASPVLVGLIAALVLVRLYPLPLRLLAGPAGRLRGAIAFLSLARAGRSAATGALPVLALLIALTTAAFGGSVLAGIADTRDRAALLSTGADALVSSSGEGVALPAGTDQALRGAPGVRAVTAVRVERTARLYRGGGITENRPLTVIAVEPQPYAALSARVGIGAFPAGALGGTGEVLHAVASPDVAERLGRGTRTLRLQGRDVTVRVAEVRPHTPAAPRSGFLLVDAARLKPQPPTALLVTGSGLSAGALRAAAGAPGADLAVRVRSEARAALTDSPLQVGATRIYAAAALAGAGFGVIALVLALLQSARERTALLARLRTMGLTTRQGRRLLGLEALPQALLAAGGGLLVGWATVALLAPGIDLPRLALAAAPGGAVSVDGAGLRADAWSLLLPAAAVVLLAGAVAAGQAWWAGRRGSITELRAGDGR